MLGRYNVRRSGPVAPSWGPKSTLTATASARSRSVPGYRIQHLHRHDQDAAETFPRARSAGRASQAIRGSDFNLIYAKKDSSSAHSCAISLSAGRFGRVAQGGRNGPSRESRGRPARSSRWRSRALLGGNWMRDLAMPRAHLAACIPIPCIAYSQTGEKGPLLPAEEKERRQHPTTRLGFTHSSPTSSGQTKAATLIQPSVPANPLGPVATQALLIPGAQPRRWSPMSRVGWTIRPRTLAGC